MTGLFALLALALGPTGAGEPYDGIRIALQRHAGVERSPEELTRALVALGPESIPLQYGLVLGAGMEALIGDEWLPEAWACQPEEIPDLCRRALAGLSAADVIAHLTQVARTRPEIKERVVAMRILTGLQAPEGLELIWSTTAELGALELGYPSVRTAVRGAMGAILSHAPTAWPWLAEHLEKTDDATAQLLVETLGEIRLPQGVAVLESLLTGERLMEATLLTSMAELEAHSPWALAGTTARYLEPRMRTGEPEQRALAAALCGRLQLASAVPTLLQLLEDFEPRVRAIAAGVLAQLGNRTPDLDAAAWSSWYERELAWREQDAPKLLEALTGPQPGPASDALRELYAHPLWKRDIARETAERLTKAPHPVGLSTCALLAEMNLRDSLPGLVQALAARDSRLRKSAWRTLQTLTGEDLPLDRAAWKAFVRAD